MEPLNRTTTEQHLHSIIERCTNDSQFRVTVFLRMNTVTVRMTGRLHKFGPSGTYFLDPSRDAMDLTTDEIGFRPEDVDEITDTCIYLR
jgi:hypothetical protein